MYAGNDMCPLLFLPSSFSCSNERARLSSRAKRAERARSEGSALGPKSRSLASLGMTCSRAVSIKKGEGGDQGAHGCNLVRATGMDSGVDFMKSEETRMGTPTMTARGGAIESINPATEEVIATFEQFTPAQVEQALVEADAAFHQWRRQSFAERSRAMRGA